MSPNRSVESKYNSGGSESYPGLLFLLSFYIAFLASAHVIKASNEEVMNKTRNAKEECQ